MFRLVINSIDMETDDKSLSVTLAEALSSGSVFHSALALIRRPGNFSRSMASPSKRFPKGTPFQISELRTLLRKTRRSPLILSQSRGTASIHPVIASLMEQEDISWIGLFPIPGEPSSRGKIGSVALLSRQTPGKEELLVATVEKGLSGLSSLITSLALKKNYQNLTDFYAALHEINHLIARRPAPDFLFDEVCRIAVDYGALRLAWIALLDQKTGMIRIKTSYGPAREYADGLSLSTDPALPIGRGPAGRAMREGKVIITEIAANHNYLPWQRLAHRFSLRSSASFPFKKSGKTIGLMGVYSDDPHYFSPSVIALLSRLSEDMEFSLSTYEQSMHIEKLQTHLESLLRITEEIAHRPDPETIFQNIVTLIVEKIGVSFAAIVELDGESQLKLSAYKGAPLNFLENMPKDISPGKPDGFGIIARTFRMGRSLVVDNFFTDPAFLFWRKKLLDLDISSGAGFPLIVDSKVAGVLVAGSSETAFFTDEIADLFENMAKNIALSIKDSKSKKQLEYLSFYDDLTALPNRASFREKLDSSFQMALKGKAQFAIGIIDIDNFKEINDSMGHAAGDLVLREIGQRFKKIISPGNILCRIGGDEFGVILNGRIGEEDILRFWTTFSDALKDPVYLPGNTKDSFYVTTSMGFSVSSGELGSAEDLLKQADQALYSAKESGRNTWSLFTPELNEKIERTIAVRRQFKDGLNRKQMRLFIQPQVDLSTGLYSGAEALLRWQDPLSGNLRLPGTFLPVIEAETGMMSYLGQWVLEEAYRLLGQPHMKDDHLSINIGALHFLHPDFLSHVDRFHLGHPDISRRLTIEITETVALSHMEISARKIRELSSRGISVSLDDFGTGFGSLSYLNNLPVQEIKIDQSFIRNMNSRPGDFAIVSGTMLTAAIRRIHVVAEGLENLATGLDLLRIGCHHAQGYGIARPMPASDLPDWKKKWSPPALWRKGIHSHFLYRGIDLLVTQVEVRAMINSLKTSPGTRVDWKILENSWKNLSDWVETARNQFVDFPGFREIDTKKAELAKIFDTPVDSHFLLDLLSGIEKNFSTLIDSVEAVAE